MAREHTCVTRHKGVEGNHKRMSPKALSSLPRRCKSRGGSSGKMNNGGRAPRFEQGGLFTQPSKRLPHHVEARSI